MKKTMRRIMETMAKVYMELLTNAVFVLVTAFIMDFGWDEDWWDAVGGGWDSIVVGILVASVYQVVRYQGQKRIKNYLETINPKVEKLVGAINRIETVNKDEAA